MLDHDWIAAHIPHQGRMCLLDAVLDWSDTTIVCRADSHTAADHPLRADGRLGIAAGIEYAAQAMAVHGVLLAPAAQPPRLGYLTSVRGVQMHAARLDDLAGALEVRAERLSGDATLILYRFQVLHEGRCLLDGRASVVLDAQAL